ncbi:MAG: lipopolysaccharide biosynthesis protein [Fusobacteriaceae bacterium]
MIDKIKKGSLELNIIYNFVLKGIGIILNFVTVPLTLKYLDSKSYGLWMLILSIVSWINIFDIGIGNGLKNKISEKIAKKEDDSLKSYIASAYFGSFLIALVIFGALVCLILSMNIKNSLKIDFIDNEVINKILLINIAFMCLNFILSLCNNIFYGMQKSYLVAINSFVYQIFNFIFIVFIGKISKNSILLLSITYGVATVFPHLILSYFYFYKNKNLLFKISDISLKKIRELFGVGSKIFMMQISGLVLFSTDNFIISYFLGMEKVSEYSVITKMFSIFTIFFSLILAPIWPAVTKAWHEGNKKWIENLLKKMEKLFLIILIGSLVFIIIGDKFIMYWTLGEIVPSKILVALCGLSNIMMNLSNIYLTILLAINILDFASYLYIFQAFLNVLLSYIFVKYFNLGSNGVVLATCFSMAINIIVLPRYVKKYLNLI